MMQWSSYGMWGADRWLMVCFMLLIFMVATVALLRMLWTGRGDSESRSTDSPNPRAEDTLSQPTTDGSNAGDTTRQQESIQTVNHS
jgi:uncharacterized membrane protein